MAESSWPSPAASRVVDDAQFEKMASAYGVRGGVIGDFTSPQLVYGDSSGMQIKVAADRYATVAGHGWWSGSSIFTKTIGANSSGSTRTDLVVLRLSRTTWDVTTVVIPGTPGAGAPSPVQNTGTTGSWDLPLATVTVANSASTISAANVTYIAPHLTSNGGYRVASSAGLTYIPHPTDGVTAWLNDTKALRVYTSGVWRRTAVFDTETIGSGRMQDTTDLTAISSTTPIAGSPVVGFSFVAPPSGGIWVTVGGRIEQSSGGNETRLGWELRTGGTVGSGTIITAVDFNRSLTCGTAVNTSQPAVLVASLRYSLDPGALTAGTTYNIRTMHYVTGAANGSVNHRFLFVEPQL